jgi:hypothetical protein
MSNFSFHYQEPLLDGNHWKHDSELQFGKQPNPISASFQHDLSQIDAGTAVNSQNILLL